VTSGKVLVLGDDTRSFLTIVRSLGRRGIIVHAAPANFRSPALRSRYIAAIHDLPPWMGDGTEWLRAITRLLRTERYELVIPCNETMLLPLQRHRARLSQLARLAIPDDRSIAVLFDKQKTREIAQRIGVRVAAGRLARPDDNAEQVLAEFGAPVVVKPRRSYSLQNLAARGKVEIIREPAQLRQLLSKSDSRETVIEQFFSGQGVGVSVLASQGRLLQAFEHHRVREIAGASFYRRSAPITANLFRASEAIVASLEYTGLAMFEFKWNNTGSWILLEVNARPWGSMPLPVALGVDFPYRWYRLLIAGEETRAVSYRTEVYGRNLLPDLRISLMEAATRQLDPVAKAWFIVARVGELLRFLTGREVHDVLVRDDPWPGLIELLEIPRALRQRVERRLPGAVARRRRRARAQLEALRRAGSPLRVVFVCQGNICRSPFAEALVRADIAAVTIVATSAGMMPQPGRPVPALGVEAAAAHGVDLSAHHSVWLNRQMAEATSVLIVFDEIIRSAVLDRYPDLKVPIIHLGDLTELGDIADPVDGGAAAFGQVYDQIAIAVAKLTQLIRRP